MVKKIVPVIALLAVLGGVYKFVLAKPAKAEPKPHVHGTVYMLQKEFLVNLADGRFAKLQIGLVLAHDDTSTVAGRRPRCRSDPARGLRRDGPGGHRPRPHHGVPHRCDRQGAHRGEGPRASSRRRSSRSSRSTPM